jgi:RNA polymerase sigma-70 factor (ECF subfamily)
MEYTSAVAVGGWRERLGGLSVRRSALEDNELVARTLAGDVRSYEELVRRYERLVGRVVYSYARREISVEDLVQETFLRAYDRLETFNPDYRFKTWLLAIANNLGVDTLRRRRELVEFNPETHAPVSRSPEAEAVDADRSRGVKEAIATLPETYGVPLVLRYTEGLSYAEIAEVLSITVPAVKSRLFRARNMLAAVGRVGGAGMNVRPEGRCDPEEIFELADGALGPEREREVRAHLGRCRGCRALYESELELNASLGSWSSRSPGRSAGSSRWRCPPGRSRSAALGRPRPDPAVRRRAGPEPRRDKPRGLRRGRAGRVLGLRLGVRGRGQGPADRDRARVAGRPGRRRAARPHHSRGVPVVSRRRAREA